LYIIRNAWLSVTRSLSRNLILCLIIFVISTAACVALSIQQSANLARNRNIQLMDIEAHINIDRQYVMDEMEDSDTTDRASMADTLSDLSSMTLADYETYEAAPSVEDFYYSLTLSLDGNDDLKPLSENEHADLTDLLDSSAPDSNRGSGAPTSVDILATITYQGDFQLIGYVSDKAMGDFQDGVSEITSGTMFEENTSDYVCVISEELATYNSLSVGDQITLVNFQNDAQKFVLTIVGLYKDSSDDTTTATDAFLDPANRILTSYAVANDILDRSEDYEDPSAFVTTEKQDSGKYIEKLLTTNGKAVTPTAEDAQTDSDAAADSTAATTDSAASTTASTTASTASATTSTASATASDSAASTSAVSDSTATTATTTDTDSSTDDSSSEDDDDALTGTIDATYLFKTMSDYEAFETQVRDLGLPDKYTVVSNDVATYEASLVPLDNLKTFALTFLFVILGIGGIVLVALNIFSIRERKYEIGVLLAMGMSKMKVTAQFVLELLMITFLSLACGVLLGSSISVPITNELLASQVAQEESLSSAKVTSFGREVSATYTKPKGGDVEGEVAYISTISFSVDYSVLLQMAAIGIALALLSGTVSSLYVMRYDPLVILTERD